MRNEATALGVSLFNHINKTGDTDYRGRVILRDNIRLELREKTLEKQFPRREDFLFSPISKNSSIQ